MVASLLAVGAIGVGALVAGCGDDDTGGDVVGDLKVGVLVPLTGDLAPFGGPGSRAADLAADQVNEAADAAGSTLEVRLFTEDTRSDPRAAREAAADLIDSDGVAAIAGPWGDADTISTAEDATVADGIPIVSPWATQADITQLGADSGLVFRTAPPDPLQGEVLAAVVGERLGTGATLNIATRDDAYGRGVLQGFTEAWTAAGGAVGRNVVYDPEAAGLDAAARRIAAGDPDGWVVIDSAVSWQRVGPALARTGRWDPARTFSADRLRSGYLPETAGREATEGMRGTAPASRAGGDARFQALWAREVGDALRTGDAESFDAVVLIALAAAAAGSGDPASIADEMAEVSGPPGAEYGIDRLREALEALADGEDIDYQGASGPIDLDENGDPSSADFTTWVYRDGRLLDEGIVPAGP